MKYKYIFFDVAYTLLNKPELDQTIQKVLKKNNVEIPVRDIQKYRKAVSEIMTVPSKTSKEFYRTFNSEVLFALGIIPTKNILDELYIQCQKLAWKPFTDTQILKDLPPSLGIVSNWDSSLEQKLHKFFSISFDPIISSSEFKVSKPNPSLFKIALQVASCRANQVLYVGDSLKLDIEPALSIGVDAVLIDRYDQYPHYSGLKISSMSELTKLL